MTLAVRQRDKLWFFAATRLAHTKNQVQGIYFNKTRGTPFYTRTSISPATVKHQSRPGGALVAATPKQKISAFTDIQSFQVRGVGDLNAMEAQTRWSFYPSVLLQANWSSPLTSKLLLEAGWSATLQPIAGNREVETDNLGFTVSPDDVAITELTTGFTYNARATYYGPQGYNDRRYVERFAASYVTGSHTFKTGFQLQHGFRSNDVEVNKNVNYGFLRGVPNRITQYASPYSFFNAINQDLGLFVQDRWTLNRLAISMGLRFDYFNGSVPAQKLAATASG